MSALQIGRQTSSPSPQACREFISDMAQHQVLLAIVAKTDRLADSLRSLSIEVERVLLRESHLQQGRLGAVSVAALAAHIEARDISRSLTDAIRTTQAKGTT